MRKSNEIACEGIVLRVIRYKDSQAIFKFLTPSHGVIQCAVRGMRNKKSNYLGVICNLNYLNLELTRHSNSDIYSLKNAHLISSLANLENYETFKYQCAGTEMFTKIVNYVEDDYAKLFHLLLTFLSYITTVKKNQITIFWRFLIKYYELLGIPFSLNSCSECQRKLSRGIGYSLDNNALICSECSLGQQVKIISPNAQELFLVLPYIGNLLDSLNIEENTKKEINEILLCHLSHSLHKDVYLKSLNN